MTACGYDPYTLPTIDFVGGETQKLVYHLYFKNTQQPITVVSCSASFSLVEYGNKHGEPIWTKDMTVSNDENGHSSLFVTLEASDTIDLCGKFIYQISIKDASGVMEIPKQGIIYITNNIDKEFART